MCRKDESDGPVSENKHDPKGLNPRVLAFVGDGVYSLLVRERLAVSDCPAGALHAESVKMVNAAAQAEAIRRIMELLDFEEQQIYKRGRNAHTGTTPKWVSEADYHAATGLEALFGWLYLSGKDQRIRALFDVICGKDAQSDF